MNYLVLDIEVVNRCVTSIATIGIVGVNNGKIVEKKEYYIKPEPFIFDSRMTKINGLNPEDFVVSPSFPEIWSDLSSRLSAYDFCVAHNASFDFGVLKGCCDAYHLNYKNIPILDSLTYTKNSYLEVPDHKLSTLCHCLNIDISNHHNALADALATAMIMMLLIEKENDNILDVFRRGGINDLSYYKSRKEINMAKKKTYNQNWGVRSKDVAAINVDCDKNNPFNGKMVVISGELKALSRPEAYAILKGYGAVILDNVTLKTDFLITNAAQITGKIKKAHDYIEKGKDIKIINESELIKLLEEYHGTN